MPTIKTTHPQRDYSYTYALSDTEGYTQSTSSSTQHIDYAMYSDVSIPADYSTNLGLTVREYQKTLSKRLNRIREDMVGTKFKHKRKVSGLPKNFVEQWRTA